MSTFLHPRVNLVLQRSMELANETYDIKRMIKLVNLAGSDQEFIDILETIKSRKSISPSLIDKAANMLNKELK